MTTFTLKKYEQTDPTDKPDDVKTSKADQEDLQVTVIGSISEIVAKALYKAMANKVDIQVKEENNESSVKAITTEDINSSPLETYRGINKDDAVFIHSDNGFKTKEEEWFLTNIGNKTDNVFYTLESFINFIQTKLNLS